MKELKNGKGDLVVFGFDVEPKDGGISHFVDYERDSIFSFYMDDDVDKIFMVDIKNFIIVDGEDRVLDRADFNRRTWELETTLDTYQELLDMGINDNVLIKVLRNRSRSWDLWTFYFDLTDATEEDIKSRKD